MPFAVQLTDDAACDLEEIYAALEPPRQRFGALAADEGQDFRGQLGEYGACTLSCPRCRRSPTPISRSSASSPGTCG